MSHNINKIPIVLHTMDSYSKYWNPWYVLFRKYVSNTGPIYFLTEEKEPDFVNDIIHIKTGKGEWGQRLLNGLSKIDTDLIFYMQEDFWVQKPFNLNDDYFLLFKKYNMDALRISSNSKLYTLESIEENLFKYSQVSNYTISHQFTLWNKRFFMENILPNETPWRNELDGSDRLKNKEHNIYHIISDFYIPTVRRGTLLTEGYELIKKNNITL